jgi:hypothetical protein
MKTLFLRAINRSDYRRWSNPENLEAWWESRTREIATLIPKGTRVIEFGAGRRWLESCLGPGSTYIPSDLVERGPGTFICDLNRRPLPDLKPMRPDVAVFVGVLEYVRDLASVVFWLSYQVKTCTASYHCAASKAHTPGRLIEAFHRATFGYLSTYSEAEFIQLFARYGFTCVSVKTWNDQRLFLFQALGNPSS